MLYYFSYGSNLHPLRLMARVPSAKLVGSTRLAGHRLMFHKRGQDDSGKCSLLNTGTESDAVFGAIYTMAHEHKHMLDRIEGNGSGYIDRRICVRHQEQEYSCFTYLAEEAHIIDNLKPYHWYKQLVVLGAQYLQFPDAYIASIEMVDSVDDPLAGRNKEHELLISMAERFS
jgi:gamma-glutamylcyclotransferase